MAGPTDRAGSRTRRAMSHAARGLVARTLSIAAVFAAMPLMLRLLGQESLGAWLVLLAIFQWVTFFDFGVAAGARNEIARAAVIGDAVLLSLSPARCPVAR